jgi:hypothetical protein
MSFLKRALELAELGFHVFPLLPNSKIPSILDFPNLATKDPDQIKRWWTDPVLETEKTYNIGISTTRFNCNHSVLVVDVDNKPGKNGGENLIKLELEGHEFPPTFKQLTPTGGEHLVYISKVPVKQGVDVFGAGLDVRANGGYIVGAGSMINGRPYTAQIGAISMAPDWMIQWCGNPGQKIESLNLPDAIINQDRAVSHAKHFLTNEAPLSKEGQGGDQTAYKVAARLKDFGVSADTAFELLLTHWNERCAPPWSASDLKLKVDHAYRYGTEPIGVSAPETQFQPVKPELDETKLHPFQELNKEYAFVIAGGGSHILWETVDADGNDKLEHLAIQSFHQKLAAQTISLGNGQSKPISQLWMQSKERRSYDGICFLPGLTSPPRFYNLWKGFTVEPIAATARVEQRWKDSLEMFLDHARENVCQGDKYLFKWLMGYFAHLVQKPWEKPLVALVFRGKKGVGKNALIDRIGHLLGSHYLLSANRRYLIGNFNGHLENLLLFALDEAFWSGDKQAEGVLKDLITGKDHVVEHKGKEPYSVKNCTRVIIIGNEHWLVPASHDERRYAVFDVGEGKKQNRTYFQKMREGMEAGGYAVLLRYLLNYDISDIEINAAPATKGLLDQKIISLDPFLQWWLECLMNGEIVGGDFGGEWPNEISKERFRDAFRRYVRDRQIRGRIPEDRTLGRLLSTCLPSLDAKGKSREGNERINTYKLPNLNQARNEWDVYIGHRSDWEV